MKRHFSRRILVIIACLAAVLAAGTCLLLTRTVVGPLVYIVAQQTPGLFNRKNMEAIVEQVRLAKMKPGKEREFKLDDMVDVKTFHAFPRKPANAESPESHVYESGKGHVFARLSEDGKLTILIETNDMGHAGSYGFVYAEDPQFPHVLPFEKDGWNPEGGIDGHWWKVGNHLD